MLFDKICGFASLLGLLLTVTSWFAAGCQMNIYWLVVLVPLLLLSLFYLFNAIYIYLTITFMCKHFR